MVTPVSPKSRMCSAWVLRKRSGMKRAIDCPNTSCALQPNICSAAALNSTNALQVIEGDDGIHGGLNDALELILAFSQGLLCRLPFGKGEFLLGKFMESTLARRQADL